MLLTLNSARGGGSTSRNRPNNLNMSADFSGGLKRSGTSMGIAGNLNTTGNDQEEEEDMREVIQILNSQVLAKSKELTLLKEEH